MHDAIVLLGFSGVGKDTTFAEIDKRYPDKFTNVKFGALAKDLTAKAFGIDVSDVEDKRKREQGKPEWCGLSPMDLLIVLYKGCTPQLTEAHIAYALSKVDHERIPVFTDIRRLSEAEVVQNNFSNPVFIYLWSSEVYKGVNDSDIESIAVYFDAAVVCRDGLTVTDVVNTIGDYLGGY